MISPQHLRPGNWIYPTGRSQFRVVTGLLLGMMEKNEDFCKEFEGIELTGQLLDQMKLFKRGQEQRDRNVFYGTDVFNMFQVTVSGSMLYKGFALPQVTYLHQLQNRLFDLTGSELPLPESALIIPQFKEK